MSARARVELLSTECQLTVLSRLPARLANALEKQMHACGATSSSSALSDLCFLHMINVFSDLRPNSACCNAYADCPGSLAAGCFVDADL